MPLITMNPQENGGKSDLIHDFNSNRKFDRDKLSIFNFLESIIEIYLVDIQIMKNSIFLIMQESDFTLMQDKNALGVLLQRIIGKRFFLCPSSSNWKVLLFSIFDKEMVREINIQEQGTKNYIVRLNLQPSLKSRFFLNYKRIIDDIKAFLQSCWKKEVKLVIF